MAIEFRAVGDPRPELLDRIAALAPENPFYTTAYTEAICRRGSTPYALFLDADSTAVSGCTAFLGTGRLDRRLEITSLPQIADKTIFWDGLVDFCRETRISILEVNTFGSNDVRIANIGGEVRRQRRLEFQLDLDGIDLWEASNRRNRRAIKKAVEAGLRFQRAETLDACAVHARIANSSLTRRRGRGESINYDIEEREARAFIENKAGEIYQADMNGEVLSSLLVLRSRSGAYAQTSGTIDAGLEYGSSQFLWYETARLLQAESVAVLNMGGTDIESKGLQEFKAGFGARRIELESAEFYLGGIVRKTVGSLVSKLRSR